MSSTIHAVKNQYRGINAHLHSYFQSEGGWDGFHTNHISDLMRLLGTQLLPLGYVAEIEESLQIRRAGVLAGKPESDVTIYDPDPGVLHNHHLHALGDTLAVAIPDIMTVDEELSQYRAVAIYEYRTAHQGEPVAWLELLSPSNKPGGQDAGSYHDKRLKLLQSGLVFVELDYLHESPSTFDRLPPYVPLKTHGQPLDGAHPYNIVVIDPRPVFIEGLAYPHPFGIDDPIPAVEIPLNGDDRPVFDFGAAYQKTFDETLYGRRLVDYSQSPLNFDRYSRPDQQRILTRMATIAKAAADGVDLNTHAPLSLEDGSAEQG